VPLPEPINPYYQEEGRDKFQDFKPSPVKLVADEPVSTFSIDVDTASYSLVRRELNNGIIPNPDAVRIEELVNYFDYNYALPETRETPFKPTVTVTDSPWSKDKKLVHIGIKGFDIQTDKKPHSNLVFLVDVSGSMDSPDKLPLVKSSLKMLLDTLQPDDTVALTVYAGSAGTVLEPTKVSDKQTILNAIDNLNAGGSTAGAAGIEEAYRLAEKHFDKEGVNRVIVATDGDFNVGVSSDEDLKTIIEKKRESGIFLSVLGFGLGNLNDSLMQTLAQNGNGTAAYIDTINEARKVLVEEASSTLFPIAKDVKIQVEFNPELVQEYRLVGYETRALNREDFNNDKIDAGDIGAGHTVTAIYEITPVGATPSVDPSRYAPKKESAKEAAQPLSEFAGEIGFLKMRYKLPKENESKLISTPITSTSGTPNADVTWATAVAGFGQLLKGDTHIGNFTYDDVIKMANEAKGTDEFGQRAEFINMVRNAKIAAGK
jgi:Ca-activated chloride channel family protein